jgi:hypothetical protein
MSLPRKVSKNPTPPCNLFCGLKRLEQNYISRIGGLISSRKSRLSNWVKIGFWGTFLMEDFFPMTEIDPFSGGT